MPRKVNYVLTKIFFLDGTLMVPICMEINIIPVFVKVGGYIKQRKSVNKITFF